MPASPSLAATQGRLRSAEEVHAMSLANLEGEYCRVTRTAELLA